MSEEDAYRLSTRLGSGIAVTVIGLVLAGFGVADGLAPARVFGALVIVAGLGQLLAAMLAAGGRDPQPQRPLD